MIRLWVVGKIMSDEQYLQWEIIGVFDEEAKALAACRTQNHFLGTVVLNQDVGDEPQEFPNTRYPLREDRG